MNLIDIALVFQIFVLLNPLSSLPILMAAYKNRWNVKKIAISAVLLAFTIAIVIALVGPYLFQVFGITTDSFRIAGGLVLLFLGLDTVRAPDKEEKKVEKIDSVVSIIATPLLTGPASISFITIKAVELGRLSVITNLVLAFIVVAIVFIMIAMTIPRINMKVVNLTSKILGLFLTAVAVEMIVHGALNIIRG